MNEGVFGFICIIIGLFLGLTIGGCMMQKIEHSNAVEAKVGQWTIDPKTGASQFQYGVVK